MKTLRNAGIAIIVGTIFGLISLIYSVITIFSRYGLKDLADKELASQILAEILPLPVFILGIIISIFVVIFTYSGFISLGRRFDKTLLVVSASFLLGVLILSSITRGIINYQIFYLSSQSQSLLVVQGLLNILFLIIYISFYILLGVSLSKLKNEVEMSKTVGILYIVSAATMIIIVGSFLLWVAQIFAALMFFKASKRFEQNYQAGHQEIVHAVPHPEGN